MKTIRILLLLPLLCIACKKEQNSNGKDACAELACQNGGTCISQDCGSYVPATCLSCQCPPGYCGLRCETKLKSTQVNNFSGTFSCGSGSSSKDINLEVRDSCHGAGGIGGPSVIPHLYFNGKEMEAEWEIIWTGATTGYYDTTTFYITKFPPYSIEQVRGGGQITPDSLAFYYVIKDSTGITIDSCYYKGVKK